jgi:hypothetical protein
MSNKLQRIVSRSQNLIVKHANQKHERQKMKKQYYGITSFGLFSAAIVLAVVATFLISWRLGFVYLAICVMSLLTMLYMYCAKCPCRTHCGHVIPGKIVVVFKDRPSEPYTPVEMVFTIVAMLFLIGLPQVWLWEYIWLFIAFWVMIVLAVIQMKTVVCRACDNIYCPAKVDSRQIE